MTIEAIRKALSGYSRRTLPLETVEGFREAAVLVLLFPKEHSLHVLLTVRTDLVETHKGQISCPGGMRDAGDADAFDTALRETEEELGIDRTGIEVLGTIDDMATPSSFVITPVVGYIDALPVYRANPDEVALVIEVPLVLFRNRESVRREERTIGQISRTVWFFPFGEHTIWGATAAILVNLIDIIDQHGASSPDSPTLS